MKKGLLFSAVFLFMFVFLTGYNEAQASSISGTVTDGTNGIQSVWVNVYDTGGSYVSGTGTDASGNYTVLGLPTGTYKVQFDGWYSGGYAIQWYNNKADMNSADLVTVTALNTTTGIDAVLAQGGSISGTVTDGTNGIQNVWVNVCDTSGNCVSGTGTDASGNYTVLGLPAGTYKVQFDGYSMGYLTQWYNNKADMNSADSVMVTALNTTTGIDAVLLAQGGSISGTVTDGTNGIQNVWVNVCDTSGNCVSGTGTDASGNYILQVIPTGSYKVWFNSYGLFAGQWFNNKGDFSSADIVSVTAPNSTPNINAHLIAGQDIIAYPFLKDFETINIGSSSSHQYFGVVNYGSLNLLMGTVSLTGINSNEFKIHNDRCSGSTLAPNSGCGVSISFEPGSVGTKTASLSISSNDPDTPTLYIPLSGTGTIQPVFNDVLEGFFAENYINTIFYNGITTGCTQNPLNYCPSNSVTRAATAAFIIRALYGEDFTYPTTPYFADAPPSNQFFKYIQKMRDEGITTGCSATEYCPTNNVTRSAMAAFIIRAKSGEDFTYTSTPYFTDVPSSNQFFKYVQKMKDEGITTGCTATEYCPSNNVTRAAMAAFLARAFLGMP